MGSKSYCEIKVEKGAEVEIIIGLGLDSDAIGSSFGTFYKTNQISGSYGAGASPMYVSYERGWPVAGQALINDSTNDWDHFTWSGKTSGYVLPSNALAHNANAKIYPMPSETTLDFKTFGLIGSGHLFYKNPGPFTFNGAAFWGYMDPVWATPFSEGDTISIAIDAARGWAWFARNGAWQKSGNPASLAFPAISSIGENQSVCVFVYMRRRKNKISANFGTGDFSYTVPTGFSGWDANLTNYHITGRVEKLGTPVARKVCLIDREWGALIATADSVGGTGIYNFNNVRGDRKYLLVALPQTSESNMNALCLDHVQPTAD
jgi:hypothetical protein